MIPSIVLRTAMLRRQGAEQLASHRHVLFQPETLHHLHKDQIADRHRCHAEQAIEPLDLRGADAMEEIDPHRGVDDDHSQPCSCSGGSQISGSASSRCASRSPSQRSRPRKARISPCCRSRIRASSMTMFVRMLQPLEQAVAADG